MHDFDVLVIGGGHAGVEAALAAARRGARVGLVTFDPAHIGAMSCNPAIGGVGKGHLVREVDAFDGVIARAADAAAIHHRMLNRSKGAAVHGPRVQADRRLFRAAVQAMVSAHVNVRVIAGEAAALLVQSGRVQGVAMADATTVRARAIVLATGTFLGGRLFRGEERSEGGRIEERAATRLGTQLRELGLPMGRLKTGTPPRLDGRTIDWAALTPQASDAEPWTMSAFTIGRSLPQVACAITRTTARGHDLIRAALDRSPLFAGAITGQGPRYCPSIEDKVARFGDRDGHQIFLEPEGLDTYLVYPNGISTSLPTDVQQALVETIPGLARARIVTPGYAVEYDYLDPRSLDASLALDAMPGLFCAGQINGTTGYEEAAAQGLVAGLNAAALALGLAPVLLDRRQSYIGVMIDDLTLQGVTEPYRMLSARAEHRLSLRADNAVTRLAPSARAAGCVTDQWEARVSRLEHDRSEVETILAQTLTPRDMLMRGHNAAQDGVRRSLREWLRFPNIQLERLVDPMPNVDPGVLAEAVEDARYAPYLARQASEVEQLQAGAVEALPTTLDYGTIPGLSNEMVERLQSARPATLEAAGRIRGVTPAALSALLLHVKRRAA